MPRTAVYIRLMEVASHTSDEATCSASYIDYAVCVDADNRPTNHKGN